MSALTIGKIYYNNLHFRLMTNNPGKWHLGEEKISEIGVRGERFPLALASEWHLHYFPFEKTGT